MKLVLECDDPDFKFVLQEGLAHVFTFTEGDKDAPVLECAVKKEKSRPVCVAISLHKAGESHVLELPVRAGRLHTEIKKMLARQDGRNNLIVMGVCVFDPLQLSLAVGDKEIRLTEKERDIMLFLYNNRGQIVEKKILLDAIWRYSEDVETHTVETHIYRLRQKLETILPDQELLATKENGYIIRL